ncbi:hypothetical protein PCE1_004623 [Barthelona sp. PCE]
MGKHQAKDPRKQKGIKQERPKIDMNLMLPEDYGALEAEGLEKTYKFKQTDIAEHVDVQTNAKMLDLELDFGSYHLDYSYDGRLLLLGGEKGHISLMEWQDAKLSAEFHIYKRIVDCRVLDNTPLIAAAVANEYTCLYDYDGLEIHRLKHHKKPKNIEYLPWHYLMCSSCIDGNLAWQDVSTGELVAKWSATKHAGRGKINCFRQNPKTAVMCAGHTNGIVSLWAPGSSNPLVQYRAHKSSIVDLCVSHDGKYLVTVSSNREVAVSDLRKFEVMDSWKHHRPVTSVDISQTGLLALAARHTLEVKQNVFTTSSARDCGHSTYMSHQIPGNIISGARFCPYEDFLGIGHNSGFQSLAIPGAGQANFDGYVANPFATKKLRKEMEVKKLLEKIPADMIGLESMVGMIHSDERQMKRHEELMRLQNTLNVISKETEEDKEKRVRRQNKRKGRGRQTQLKKLIRKKALVRDTTRERLEYELQKLEKQERKEKDEANTSIFDRFK